MRVVEIIRVDTRGRITLPSSLRDSFSIAEGMHVMLIGDLERHEIRILPFADPEAELVEIQITLIDKLGSLAEVAAVLTKHKIDLLTSQSRTLRRGRTAEWFFIADISNRTIDIDKLCAIISNTDSAEKAVYKRIEQ
ncbi:MAG: AbrB family transcriptional regulator [Asgard group archaeon]|nr:AbrB family transcriptional regulator [Asgard group archaeon]